MHHCFFKMKESYFVAVALLLGTECSHDNFLNIVICLSTKYSFCPKKSSIFLCNKIVELSAMYFVSPEFWTTKIDTCFAREVPLLSK